jgi:hypothetical protein
MTAITLYAVEAGNNSKKKDISAEIDADSQS